MAEKSTLSITDNRTGKAYEVPVENGTIRAMDLRKIKVDEKDFGLMTYDPAFTNTASCKSAITFIDGDKGILEYRGYPIEELAEKSTFLEVAWLLLKGELPTAAQLKEFTEHVTMHTYLHENVKKLMEGFRHDAHPMGMLLSTVGALSTFYPDAKQIFDVPSRDHHIVRLIAKMPTIAAFVYLPSSFAALHGVSDALVDHVADPRVVATLAVAIGIVLAGIILWVTGYFTGTTSKPTLHVARTSLTGPATVVLSGIGVGFESAVYTAGIIAAAICGVFLISGGSITLALFLIALAGCGTEGAVTEAPPQFGADRTRPAVADALAIHAHHRHDLLDRARQQHLVRGALDLHGRPARHDERCRDVPLVRVPRRRALQARGRAAADGRVLRAPRAHLPHAQALAPVRDGPLRPRRHAPCGGRVRGCIRRLPRAPRPIRPSNPGSRCAAPQPSHIPRSA